jgi:hypothetical protein
MSRWPDARLPSLSREAIDDVLLAMAAQRGASRDLAMSLGPTPRSANILE